MKYPVVMCPGCKQAMRPSRPRPLPLLSGLIEITYTCEKYGTTTKRTIKNNDEKKPPQLAASSISKTDTRYWSPRRNAMSAVGT